MNFDDRLKARAAHEDCPIPNSFDRRIDALTEALPPQSNASRKRRPVRRMVVIGVAAALCLAGAAGAGVIALTMHAGQVSFFEKNGEPPKTAALQNEYEKYNAAVGQSQTKDGQTLTIDNLTADDSYVSVFYTFSSETAIAKPGTNSDPESWRAIYAAPRLLAQIDG